MNVNKLRDFLIINFFIQITNHLLIIYKLSLLTIKIKIYCHQYFALKCLKEWYNQKENRLKHYEVLKYSYISKFK